MIRGSHSGLPTRCRHVVTVNVDYFSRYVELALLTQTKCKDVINHLKSMFARYSIPESLMSDNGPQLSGQAFASYAKAYEFKHLTSSPKFPCSNGEAEQAVQTMKSLLKKATDPYLALLAYRATPLQNGYSPAQLLMGRCLHTTVPTYPSELQPALPDHSSLFQKEREKRMSDAANFNRRHCAKPLCSLSPGQEVWITDSKTSGSVIQRHTSPRSYLVDAPHGVVRRNRLHLIPLQSPAQDEGGQQQPEPLPVLEQDHAPPALGSPVPSPEVSTPRTRSGRVIKQPTRLNL
uniref:Integrase catalytic domain-containing protein n=1 Tax=Fundulus heteroclitus TaxID=8078 RepID=A0A3Q2QP68_FUNHE